MEPRRLRVIDTDAAEPSYTAACDEAMMIARSKDLVPDTLHLYRRSRPVISLGYFQDAESCVDIELCQENGISMLRRLSGGSAIYTDPGQVIYSIALSGDEVPESPAESYPIICQGIVLALERLGIAATWKPLNDVLVNGRKISGSAQTRQHGVVLQHGTLLVNTDLDLMVSLLRPLEGKMARSRTDLITVNEACGRAVDMADVRSALVWGFCLSLGRESYYDTWSQFEKDETKRLVKEKYGTERHTLRRSLE